MITKIYLGDINNAKETIKNYFDQLVNLFCNKINKSNDLSFFYYDLVDKWNNLLFKISKEPNVLKVFELDDGLYEDAANYQMPHEKERKYIRIYSDNYDVYLIVSDEPFKTANHIYITQKELGEL